MTYQNESLFYYYGVVVAFISHDLNLCGLDTVIENFENRLKTGKV